MLLQISDCCKSFGSRILFEKLNLEIKAKEKAAIIGKNGIGKTTLLEIIAGMAEMDSGVIKKDKGCHIGYLNQTVLKDGNISALQELEKCFAQIKFYEMKLKELEELLQTQCSDEILENYGRAWHNYENLGGYNYQTEIKTLFSKFGFPLTALQKKVSEFSGGEKTKLAFIKLLLTKPDLLLLDEPTNHLDIDTVQWLEGYINKYPSAVIIVSHDRMFLDKTVNIVYEIEEGTACKYNGNYSEYLTAKRCSIARQKQRHKTQQKEIKHLEELIERFRYKATKARLAQSKIKYLERMTLIDEIKEDDTTINVSFTSHHKGAIKALVVNNLSVGYTKSLFKLSFELLGGRRIAVIGKNGTGKSTLVKTLAGQIKPLNGSYQFGDRIDVGYFDQELTQLAEEKSVIEELWDCFPDAGQTEIRHALGRFQFRGEDVFKQLNVLSGGEKVRLALAKLMLQHDNFLLLDEPTNHLDIYGREALEKALNAFDGSIFLVSHDRYFIAAVATAIIEISDNKAVYYDLPYNEYMQQKKTAPDS